MDRPAPRPAAEQLRVAVGQYSDRGRKPSNQDFHGLCIPDGPLLGTKGIAVALADGISSSDVSHIASETAVASFLEDYYCTPESWPVKKSAQRVLSAANAWLHAQTRQGPHRHDQDRGYVCAMSVLVLKSTTAHVLHIGDARIFRMRGNTLEQLTDDHRIWVSRDKSYLGRALGLSPHLEVDYHTRRIESGDVFVLATDGVYEHVDAAAMIQAVRMHAQDLDGAAGSLADLAYACGSTDNLTVQIVRVDGLPAPDAGEVARQAGALPCPPLLQAGMEFEGFRIDRELHASSRSHVYHAIDIDTGTPVAIKIPSLDLRHDPVYLERLLMEEWIARRIDSHHVVKAWPSTRPRRSLYTVSEYLEGTTLTRWMAGHHTPPLEQVVGIIEQVARGLQAFHRQAMVHQDLRPDNILIDAACIARIIDFGSTRVAGIAEIASAADVPQMLGTAQYAAPEYFLGEPGSTVSDIYSLGVIAYQMLTGRLPYGTQVAQARTRAAQRNLRYESALDDQRAIPAWVDGVLSQAVHPDPQARYQELSEFTYALRHPHMALNAGTRPPLLERNPLAFWKGLCLLLALALVLALALR
ncbi:bifunctional protein-serine/threonine kinase/phosphatase [Bordetella sp. BOR01]|uniref:bifunctional protein-serine/threonine kinase/phosphatase n=1 Tax=Bordetella sp. BOR01 TaxID=2854779 RepID=UPI001C44624E|nr:bifunctional protein-serine/threonine kinase/phosphatase [Bordetella sp. BOR01]MBV7485164.1 bifunctional protein-serine/threonine kinase/phosphatase [Bordetella sp. BOR01]